MKILYVLILRIREVSFKGKCFRYFADGNKNNGKNIILGNETGTNVSGANGRNTLVGQKTGNALSTGAPILFLDITQELKFQQGILIHLLEYCRSRKQWF